MLGIDVVDIERLRKALERSPRLEERLFRKEERTYCRRGYDPIIHFAGTLAAKEAVIKALRLGPLAAWASRIEIARDADGVPTATVDGRPGAKLEISISHDGPVAVAIALDLTGIAN
jgi:holo-[acyl-carrier protein] synthase